LASLRFSLGINQISKTFNLRQIETSVLERAAGEFTSFGCAKTGERGEVAQNSAHDRDTAVQVKFNDLLPGEAAAFGEHKDQGFIQPDAFGIRYNAQRGAARFGQITAKLDTGVMCLWARDANDRNPRPTLCGRKRVNRIHETCNLLF
jgi:hypothetical protein